MLIAYSSVHLLTAGCSVECLIDDACTQVPNDDFHVQLLAAYFPV
jgi:hypothetical protein